MANTAYVGAGTTLGTSYYMRRFYAANADARTTTSRSNLTNSTLTGADSHALRRAIRSLGSFTYDDDNEINIKNSVSAFISTYNNTDLVKLAFILCSQILQIFLGVFDGTVV